jgi:excisionase family DNA binding protein
MDIPRLISIPEACEILGGICRATLYRLVKSEKLKLVKVGSRSFVPDTSLASYLNELGAI